MLLHAQHPFMVHLHGTFQDDTCIYLVMQFVAGGEMFTLMRDRGRCDQNETCKLKRYKGNLQTQ